MTTAMILRKLPILAAVASVAVHAAPVAITVRGADGGPLAGAVVTVESPRFAAPVPRAGYAIEQRDIAFQPHVLIVPVGATVAFPNRDRVRHHVYSFSRPKRFDLKLYGREDTRSITFDQPGIVALGCNIHDSMSGFVAIVTTPYAAQTGADGTFRIAGVPAGPAVVRVWHPSIRAPGNVLTQSVTIPPTGLSTGFAIRR